MSDTVAALLFQNSSPNSSPFPLLMRKLHSKEVKNASTSITTQTGPTPHILKFAIVDEVLPRSRNKRSWTTAGAQQGNQRPTCYVVLVIKIYSILWSHGGPVDVNACTVSGSIFACGISSFNGHSDFFGCWYCKWKLPIFMLFWSLRHENRTQMRICQRYFKIDARRIHSKYHFSFEIVWSPSFRILLISFLGGGGGRDPGYHRTSQKLAAMGLNL